MKGWKSIGWLSLGVVVVFFLTTVILPALAMEDGEDITGVIQEENVIAEGQVNDTVTWRVTEDERDNRCLIIEGQGAMTDYKKADEQPWNAWKGQSMTVIIEDGITRIGNYSMSWMSIQELQLGRDVESIGENAFSYGSGMTSIVIPGHVKRVEKDAFVYHYSLTSVTLEDGVEEIMNSAFGFQTNVRELIHIPASVKTIGEAAFWTASGYEVDLENAYYVSDDGILYTKDGTTLVDYPNQREAIEYRIPERVTTIRNSALCGINSLKRVIIPATVRNLPVFYLFRGSAVEEVYVEDGVPLSGNNTFYSCSKISKVRFPENTEIKVMDLPFGNSGSCLESLKIPDGVKKINSVGYSMKALSSLIYDAADAKVKDYKMLDTETSYALTIGEHVDVLPAEFRHFSAQAESILFAGENQLRVAAGAFEEAEEPLNQLAGMVYVDGQGVLYLYDSEDSTAKVVYCQPGQEDILIPAQIQPEEGVSCQVVSVGQYAWKNAAGVRSVTFEKPEQIIQIEPYGFANCQTLERINGTSSVEQAKASFGRGTAGIGYRAFYLTGLSGEDTDLAEAMTGCSDLEITGEGKPNLNITVSSEGGTMEWEESEEDGLAGEYHLLTGDTMTIYAAAGNREGEENYRCRLYFQWSDRDCSMSVKSGETYTFDDQKAVCCATEDPNSIYMEFVPMVGKTLGIPVTVLYPSPTSDGGQLNIWAVILDETEADRMEEKLVFSPAGMITARWTTQRDGFSLTKTGNAGLTLQGTEDGQVIPGKHLEWKIVLQRTDDTVLSYGKDYVRSVSYEDTMYLPQGLRWKSEVKEAVKNGKIRRNGNFLYADEQRVVYLDLSGGQLNLYGLSLTWDEEGDTAVLRWKVSNTVKSAQMNTNTLSCIFYAEAFETDMDEFQKTETPVVVNRVSASVAYDHSEKENLYAEAEKTFTIAPGSLSLTNQTTEIPYYFGESVEYTIMLRNPGALSYQGGQRGSWYLQNLLSPYTYITVEEMEEMFASDSDRALSITISNVQLTEWEAQQGIFEESVFWQNGSNSGENQREKADSQLRIGWNAAGDDLEVEVNGKIFREATLAESLKKAGYTCGRWDEYTVSWRLNPAETLFVLKAGETRQFTVSAKAKNTFQMLSEDWAACYPTDAQLTLINTASLLDQEEKIYKNASVRNPVVRECYVAKHVYKHDKRLQDGFFAEDGDCLEYVLEFAHYGKGSYENLPIVDDMYGAQALLVSKEKNPQLADQELEIYIKEKQEYYVLTEGSYQNVKAGGGQDGQDYIAAMITVEAVSSGSVTTGDETHSYRGLHTHIEWKCRELPSKSYKLYLAYETVVRQKLSGDDVYVVGNTVWMNDRLNSRLYAPLWGGGTMIDFRKDIVEEKGKNWEYDELDEDGYSLVSAGEQVIYRITLRNKGEGIHTINGEDIADQLPRNGSVFQWEKGINVSLFYESSHASTQISGIEQWTIQEQWEESTAKGQQYILWPEETRIQFSEKEASLYLYVTLTYPKREDSMWDRYAAALNGEYLENAFYVYEFPVNVTHHLREPGQVLLQKGVYGMSYGRDKNYTETMSRSCYNNQDSQNRQITYYLLLYNGGAKRWYLNDIYDALPKGCTFTSLINDRNLNKTSTSVTISTLSDPGQKNLIEPAKNAGVAENIVYKTATIRQKDAGEGQICFQISRGQGTESICYDEEQEQYYLNQKEAIVFGYICNISTAEETEDVMLNTAFMRYTDLPKTGVEIITSEEASFAGAITEIHSDQNDGTCSLMMGYDMRDQFAVKEGTGKDEWLLSDVTVSRGEIIPGITKYTESFITAGSVLETEYENAVGPYDQINWRARLHNSGTLSITDYTFQDILPAPYVFCGSMEYTIYDYAGKQMSSYHLVSFSERAEDKIIITNRNSKSTISLDGEKVPIYISTYKQGQLSIHHTDQGEEVLTIRFSDSVASIPEGGYVDLTFSSYNPTNQFRNSVYTNQAILKPEKQSFAAAAQGSLIRDGQDRPEAVKNSSPVTVSFGYATSSEKSVQEKGTEKNQAVSSNLDKNYIVLSSQDSIFSYQLTVTNNTEKAMERLIFLDSLPDIGDSSPFYEEISRNSKFRVDLAEETNIRVKVILQDGTSAELDEEDYSLDYTQRTQFQNEDWNGTSKWTGTKDQARAIRIIISDQTGEKIPAGATVEVSFDCRISGNAEAGEIAWNSFGYHYKLQDLEQELEAMPLAVGVKTAEVPVLKKRLVDLNGNEVLAETDETFLFLIYEGEEQEESFSTVEEWIQELENHHLRYMTQNLVVQRGQSSSDPVKLKEFQWEEGTVYTVMEVLEDSRYECRGVNGGNRNVYSFSYGKDRNMTISFKNEYQEWNLKLTKTDSQDAQRCLEGAVFGIYSMRESDQIKDLSEYTEYEAQIVLAHNDQSWYLMDIQRTDAEGTILWTHLKEKQYLLKELKAPDGYHLDQECRMVYRRNAVSGTVEETVANDRGIVFPMTGAGGRRLFSILGSVMAVTGCIMYQNRKKGKKHEKRKEIN